MSITIGDRPGRWVRGCSTDPAYDYCAVLGMGDFQTLEWLTDANNNNALDSIYVKNDLGGLIASFDTMPTGVLYDSGGSAADTVSFTTSTTNTDGSITLTYGPDAGPNYIAGTWSVAINGIGVTLFNGDTCTVNFNQTFFGTTTAYSFTTAKQASVNVTQTGGIGWIDWDDGSGLEAFDASGGSTTTTHSYSTEALRTITVLCDALDITSVDISSEEAIHIDISKLTKCLSFFLSFNSDLAIVINPGLNTQVITGYQLLSSSAITQLNLQGFPNFGGAVSIKTNPVLNTILHPTTGQNFTSINFRDNTSLSELDMSTYTGTITSIQAFNCDVLGSFISPISSGTTSTLHLYSNALTLCDLSGHTGLSNDIWIQDNPALETIVFPASSGTVDSLRLFSCDLAYNDFTGLTLATSSLSVQLEINGMTATEVNHYLVDLDGMLGAGTGTIDISGTNAAPDGSSGGYDGTTAKSNLISNGYTVTTT